ncbi:MAG: radical SAM protein [Elusimicrobia bacterium RIFCSPLOWO2_01_FULL_59_12]|nr:MAG: radical SAM protein [Elusimicrobia bacterium RIFCSPLOWO2_01_FULL_59_12]
MTVPGFQLRLFGGRLKQYLKQRRFMFRSVYGLRALREGARGLAAKKRGSKDHLGATLSFIQGSDTIRGRPMNVTIEPTNACNLGCPVCETGAKTLGRTTEHMSLNDFKSIMDQIAPHTNTLMFYFMGEPFLNKNAYDMIAYAKSIEIPFITTCTNGDLVNPEKLAQCGLDEVNFQIGGMTQETHQVYRINSQITRVLENLKATIRFRNQFGSRLRIASGFILMKHNEHEAEAFNAAMAELGVDQANIIDPCVRTYEQGLQYLPTNQAHWQYDPEAFKAGKVRPRFLPPNECPWIYYSVSIHVSGNVVPCCRDPLGEYVMGNILTQSLQDIWNGPQFRSFRQRLHHDQGQINICRLCSSYAPSEIK